MAYDVRIFGRQLARLFLLIVVVASAACHDHGSGGYSPPSTTPVINGGQEMQPVNIGQSATFSVDADAFSTVQWQRDGANISGANGNTYTTPPVTAADSGALIGAVITTPSGVVEAPAVSLLVNVPPAPTPPLAPPTIATQPAALTVQDGAPGAFGVVAQGSAPLSYQWLRNGTPIAGATQSTYDTPASGSGDNGAQYSVTVSNAAGSVASAAAVLTVLPPPVPSIPPPVIATQPVGLSATLGSPASFSVSATGTAPLAYQWRRNGVEIAGATDASYALPKTMGVDNGARYSVQVINPGGSVLSSEAVLSLSGVAILAGEPGVPGSADGTGRAARFNAPAHMGMDAAGNVYLADRANHTLRKITPQGETSTVAGSAGAQGNANGTGSAARLNQPFGVITAADGTSVISDTNNFCLRRVSPAGEVTALAGRCGSPGYADGSGDTARFSVPRGLGQDAQGNAYLADRNNYRVRKITPAGEVSTVAGSTAGFVDGIGAAARFNSLEEVIAAPDGTIFVADTGNHAIRQVNTDGNTSTLAGGPPPTAKSGYVDGSGTDARFFNPFSISIDAAGNLFVADSANRVVRRIAPPAVASTVAGTVESGTPPSVVEGQLPGKIGQPFGIINSPDGKRVIVSTTNHVLLEIALP